MSFLSIGLFWVFQPIDPKQPHINPNKPVLENFRNKYNNITRQATKTAVISIIISFINSTARCVVEDVEEEDEEDEEAGHTMDLPDSVQDRTIMDLLWDEGPHQVNSNPCFLVPFH